MIKKIKNAGLWIRLLSITIDVFLFCSLAMSLSLICLQNKYFEQLDKSIYVVKNDYWYYLWLFFLILMLLIFFVVIPIFTKGKTIGMLLTRLELKIQDGSFYKVILKRNQFSTLLWIVLIVLFMIFVNPKIVNKIAISSYINKNYKNSSDNEIQQLLSQNSLTILETSFYTIVSTLSPIILLEQLFLLMSSGFKKEKISIVDRLTKSQIVYSNKFEKIKQESEINLIKPIKNISVDINWKE
ncbi:MAG: RDD family protein [Mycoplasmataceae bacterium]|nr:RDD family protein [Mycoplasmataceae bacterium]